MVQERCAFWQSGELFDQFWIADMARPRAGTAEVFWLLLSKKNGLPDCSSL
jgi:hypothetical protein